MLRRRDGGDHQRAPEARDGARSSRIPQQGERHLKRLAEAARDLRERGDENGEGPRQQVGEEAREADAEGEARCEARTGRVGELDPDEALLGARERVPCAQRRLHAAGTRSLGPLSISCCAEDWPEEEAPGRRHPPFPPHGPEMPAKTKEPPRVEAS